MKTLIALFLVVLAFRLTSGHYVIDLESGTFAFKNKEEKEIEQVFNNTSDFRYLTYNERQVTNARLKQVNAKTAMDLTKIETNTGSNVDPMPVKFHSKNRLRNGQLLVVKRKVFGNSIKDGHRWIFYMYGTPDLGTFIDVMNNELGMDNKYRLISFTNKRKYVRAEVRSNFVVIK